MSEGKIIGIYNQSISQVIGIIKELSNEIKTLNSQVETLSKENKALNERVKSLKIIPYCKVDELFYNKG